MSDQTSIPAVYMRGGTSKGLLFNHNDLPKDQFELDKYLLAAMGSPDLRQINGIGEQNDLLIIISTSGNSKNILNAINAARKKNIYCIGLLGRDGGMAIKKIDYSITIRSRRTCRIQEMHGLIIHIVCYLVEKHNFN